MKNIQDLYDFIDRAAKSHKYPDNTAWSLKSAIKKFEPLLNEEERTSVEKFRDNLDPLTQKLFNKDKSTSASSLTTYKSRVTKVISDFEKYGNDASKMANWTVKTISRTRHSKIEKEDAPIENGQMSNNSESIQGMARFELPLRPGMKFVLIVPPDISDQERSIIKALLDSLNQK